VWDGTPGGFEECRGGVLRPHMQKDTPEESRCCIDLNSEAVRVDPLYRWLEDMQNPRSTR
jgi:hypothetical protein